MALELTAGPFGGLASADGQRAEAHALHVSQCEGQALNEEAATALTATADSVRPVS
jgi:hypothetical protein